MRLKRLQGLSDAHWSPQPAGAGLCPGCHALPAPALPRSPTAKAETGWEHVKLNETFLKVQGSWEKYHTEENHKKHKVTRQQQQKQPYFYTGPDLPRAPQPPERGVAHRRRLYGWDPASDPWDISPSSPKPCLCLG